MVLLNHIGEHSWTFITKYQSARSNVHDAIPVSLIVDVLDGNITEMDVELVDYVNIVDVLNAVRRRYSPI